MVKFLRKIIESFLDIFRNQKRPTCRLFSQTAFSQARRIVSKLNIKKKKIPVKRVISSKGNTIKRSAKFYWEEKGWLRTRNKTSNTYRGYYRTIYGSFRGMVTEIIYGSKISFYIYNPPCKLQDHPHGPCFFKHQGKGKFFIHFKVKPDNIDSGIKKIEHTIHESFSEY